MNKEYKLAISFKHLGHWEKIQSITAKSTKKAMDIARHMYKDRIKNIRLVQEDNDNR